MNTFTFRFNLTQVPSGSLAFVGWLLDTATAFNTPTGAETIDVVVNAGPVQSVSVGPGANAGYAGNVGVIPTSFSVTWPTSDLQIGERCGDNHDFGWIVDCLGCVSLSCKNPGEFRQNRGNAH